MLDICCCTEIFQLSGNANEIIGMAGNGNNKFYFHTSLTQCMNERSTATVDFTNQ